MQINSMIQGSPDWHLFRSKHINSTDAAPILGVAYKKTAYQLWEEKLGLREPEPMNDNMRRGVELEEPARQCLSGMIGVSLKPAVFEHSERKWQAASLDGYNGAVRVACEIKCGKSAYDQACKGVIPNYYTSQLHHIMSVCDLSYIHYFCYLSDDQNELLTVHRDDDYIRNMIEKEYEFWQGLQTLTPPPTKYIERNSEKWKETVELWKLAKNEIKEWEDCESRLRKDIIDMCEDSSCKGAGVKVSKIVRKGNIIYGDIPELKNIDLEKYRSNPVTFWKIENES